VTLEGMEKAVKVIVRIAELTRGNGARRVALRPAKQFDCRPGKRSATGQKGKECQCQTIVAITSPAEHGSSPSTCKTVRAICLPVILLTCVPPPQL
jgi:hypothetical protein